MNRVWHLLFSTTIVQTKRKEFLPSVIFNSEKNNRWIPGKQLDRRAYLFKSLRMNPTLYFKFIQISQAFPLVQTYEIVLTALFLFNLQSISSVGHNRFNFRRNTKYGE